jgi:exodeoxyribonuclease-3
MLTYKLHFYDQMIAYLKTRSEHTLIIGDFNIAHTEIDLARPQENINNI